MTNDPLRHPGPPNVAAARAQMTVIGDHIEHGRTLDAERAENALLRYALDAFRDAERWDGIRTRGMKKNFGWEQSASAYKDLYLSLLSRS